MNNSEWEQPPDFGPQPPEISTEKLPEIIDENHWMVTSTTQVQQSRAVAETQAALVIAKRFPRDMVACHKRIMDSCKRLTLASQAVYQLPIGGKVQKGPSIRLAEELARQWGNIEFGIREVERNGSRSKCIAYAWDKESNSRSESEFDVEHWIEVGQKGNKTKRSITDPVEVDRLIANRGARKLRNCILAIVPGDIVDDAVNACKATVARGGGEPLIDRVKKMVAAFGEIGVNQAMLEKRLTHQIDLTTGEEIADLQAIFKAIVDKEANRSKFFDFPDEESDDTRTAAKTKIDNVLGGANGQT